MRLNRRLVCIKTVSAPYPPVTFYVPAGGSWEIIEGYTGITPLRFQGTQIGSDVAELLASKDPQHWRIDALAIDNTPTSVKIEAMSTPNPVTAPTANPALTPFEQILLKIVLGTAAAAPGILPIFVHSTKGTAIVNASETLFSSILSQFSTPA